jgi:phytoene synthase
MTDDTDYCEALVRDVDKDRFLATLFVPQQRRSDLFALYAFDLETAAVAHRVREPAAGEIRLQWWEDALRSGDGAAGHPVADALARMLSRTGIPRGAALALIDARRRALYPERDCSEAAFERYASETAGAVFDIAAQVLGGPSGEAARLAAHHAGVAAAASQTESGAGAFDAAAVSQRHRTAVRTLIADLPGAILPAFLPLALAVEGRARLPQWRKQWILWRASRNLARWL